MLQKRGLTSLVFPFTVITQGLITIDPIYSKTKPQWTRATSLLNPTKPQWTRATSSLNPTIAIQVEEGWVLLYDGEISMLHDISSNLKLQDAHTVIENISIDLISIPKTFCIAWGQFDNFSSFSFYLFIFKFYNSSEIGYCKRILIPYKIRK